MRHYQDDKIARYGSGVYDYQQYESQIDSLTGEVYTLQADNERLSNQVQQLERERNAAQDHAIKLAGMLDEERQRNTQLVQDKADLQNVINRFRGIA